jgi:DNA-binding response OmpR family regulator
MIYRFSNCELDAECRELRCAGQQVAIEPRAFDVLAYLLQHRGRVVAKQELLDHCWAETFVGDGALTQCLAKIRKAIQAGGTVGSAIQTVYGRGYRFVTPVTTDFTVDTAPATIVTDEHPPPATYRSKILIVDDEPFNIDYLEQVLEELGYETIRAVNGQAALEKVASEAPDLILLDVMMPGMDGFTVCRILKGDDSTRLIPIVIMTALDAPHDRIQGIRAGADDFLTKPVNEEALLARIETALKLKHTMDRRLDELDKLKANVAQIARLITPPPQCS